MADQSVCTPLPTGKKIPLPPPLTYCMPSTMHLGDDSNSLKQLQNASAEKRHSSERKPNQPSKKKPEESQGTAQSREQDRAVESSEMQGQGLSLLLCFYNSLNAHEALGLIFHHLFLRSQTIKNTWDNLQ